MSTPAAFEHRIGDRLPAGRAEHDGLALEPLMSAGASPLRKAKSKTSAPPIWKTETSGMPCVEAEREHAGRGIAHVGLALVDQLDGRGRLHRPGLERRLDVAEIAELLGRPNRDSRRAPRWCRAARPSAPCRLRVGGRDADRRRAPRPRRRRRSPSAGGAGRGEASLATHVVRSLCYPVSYSAVSSRRAGIAKRARPDPRVARACRLAPFASPVTPPSSPISSRARRRRRRSKCR